MPTDPFSPRKSVRQSRARDTIDAILQASSQILAKDGLVRLTTNHIATIAGVSVGSLYQYFPSKDAVVHALIEREFNRTVELVVDCIESIDPQKVSLDEAIRMICDSVLNEHVRRRSVYRELLLGALSFRHLRFTLDNDKRILSLLRAKLVEHPEVDPERIELATFVALYAIKGLQIGLAFSEEAPEEADYRPLLYRMVRACLVKS